MPEFDLKPRRIDGEDGIRYYPWLNDKFPSVTSILRDGVPKAVLAKWQANLIINTVVKDVDTLATDFAGNEDGLKKYLSTLADESKDSSSARGTVVHDYADHTAKGLPFVLKGRSQREL